MITQPLPRYAGVMLVVLKWGLHNYPHSEVAAQPLVGFLRCARMRAARRAG
jgi:hypothetical protein